MSETDLELLQRYVRYNAEEAFAEIVRRHVDLVHSAALRQVRSPELAEEVAQAAFLKLAHHAPRLAPNTILTAWLYQVTRREAIDVGRRETRRRLREQVALEMNAINADASDWRQIEPILDEAMEVLDEADRVAVLLRYFENKSLREVGDTLGISDDTAQKRVSRAVERLRDFLARRGVVAGSAGLGVLISTHAVHVAPAGLVKTITTAAMSAASTALLTTTASLGIMKTVKISMIVGCAVVVLAGAAHFVWKEKIHSLFAVNGAGGRRAVATNEILYREMTNAAPIAGEVVAGDPIRMLWESRRATLLNAGYIETRDIPLPKAFTTQRGTLKFFERFQNQFRGVEMGIRRPDPEAPPIAYVTARKIDFGPKGAVEQFIRNYDPEE
jgi:RNA polymerase sigma factor (sigma-70 family)